MAPAAAPRACRAGRTRRTRRRRGSAPGSHIRPRPGPACSGIIARGQEATHERRRRGAGTPGSRSRAVRARAGRVRRPRRGGRGRRSARARPRCSSTRPRSPARSTSTSSAFPATARFFLAPDGTPDRTPHRPAQAQPRPMAQETAEAALTHDFVVLPALGRHLAHSHREHGPGGKIPPQFMVAAMSLTQTALAGIFRDELGDPARGARGGGGVEQAAAAPPERAADRLPAPAAPDRLRRETTAPRGPDRLPGARGVPSSDGLTSACG